MTNVQAALLYGQLECLDEILSLKEELFETYRKEFSKLDFLTFQKIETDTIPANWMFGIRFINGITYEKAFKLLQEKDIDSRPMFYSHEKHDYLNNRIVVNKNNDIANKINETSIILPSYPSLKKEEVKHIIATIGSINKCL